MAKRSILLSLLGLFALASFALTAMQDESGRRGAAFKAYRAGNYKDALELYRELLRDPANDPKQTASDLNMATESLARLGRVDEQDALREEVAALHGKEWRALWGVAESYLAANPRGYMVAGEFERGGRRGGGKAVSSRERDRTRALQLLAQALPLVSGDDGRSKGAFHLALARALLRDRTGGEAWRLQERTDLSVLPDYEDGWYWRGGTSGAPVDAGGKPVVHGLPDTFDSAASDGERWRWALLQAVEMDSSLRNQALWLRASFALSQFGVHTALPRGWRMQEDDDAGEGGRASIYSVHTLTEEETLARLATGVKRFEMPAEHNYIKLLRQILAEPAAGYTEEAYAELAREFQNRRQFGKAAEELRRAIKAHGAGKDDARKKQLDQIVGNWGRFEGGTVQPAGKGAVATFTYRNSKYVEFDIHEIETGLLLADVKAYIKSSPRELDWNKMRVDDVGQRIVARDESRYLGKRVASWGLDLDPLPDHWDRQITVTTPMTKAGAYLLTAKVKDGSESKIVLWVSDMAIVRHTLANDQSLLFVADAVTGAPVERALVEYFGFRQERIERSRTYAVKVSNFAEYTNGDGLIVSKRGDLDPQYQWLITARTDSGRLAFLGFTNVWYPGYHDAEYNEAKVFTITDRPVYRPGHKVRYKFWVRHAKYDKADESTFAGQHFTIEIYTPTGERMLERSATADEFGGIDGELDLPAGATLGLYRLTVKDRGGSTFRVEEYKKPEFEVDVEAPSEPVMLGEKVRALVKAKYYFGSPVQEARVKYKVTRTSHTQRWFPSMPWDWMYGPGYWWFAYDAPWYPGFHRWGCLAPLPWWADSRGGPPEIVAEGEAAILPDGTFPLEIDTGIAKALHGDLDHRYQITAEVTDASRRTITGGGSVLVAREPFKVYVWLDRGHYRTGQTIGASFKAQTPDHKPVEGKGDLRLLRISYREGGEPSESEVQRFDLPTNDRGEARMQLFASEPGQYRLSYRVTDGKGRAMEGGYIFTVAGERFDGADFRFNAVELIPDKADYAPGESVKLRINTNQSNSTVLLFTRPSNGVYLMPKIVRILGKSTVEEIAVATRDMPNFFVEAVTISGAKLHRELREIIVPPAGRTLDVAVEPSSAEYRPGAKGSVKVSLRGEDGKPFTGSTVVAIYDKAVEAISGGSNVPGIREFFWKWRRSHNPRSETDLGRTFGNLARRGLPVMARLGVFGWLADFQGGEWGERARRDGGFSQGGGAPPAPGAPAPETSAAGAVALDEAVPRLQDDAAKSGGDPGQSGGDTAFAEAEVRSNFADTALWVANLTTDGDGVATVDVDLPESLTTWKIRAWSVGHGTRVGEAASEVVTRKDLMVRLQAPRFFVEKDEVVLSANVHNYLDEAKSVRVEWDLEGGTLEGMAPAFSTATVEAGGEARIDFRVKVVAEGQALVRVRALTDVESDAMQLGFPVYVHGMLKTESWASAIRSGEDSSRIVFRVPEERKIAQSRLEVRYSPTLAGAMVDALPYLASYPYGCTEQTLNRFLPSVITQKILLDMGLDLKAIGEKRTNLNAQEIGDDRERAKGWKRFEHNPVFDEAELLQMVKQGVRRLGEMQLSDGGWGWFSGYGEHSYPHTTAYVVHGLRLAAANDVAIVPDMISNGLAWLDRYQARQIQLLKNAEGKIHPWRSHADNLDAFVYMVLAESGNSNGDMREYLYRDRNHLAVYTKAMFALALHKEGERDKLEMLTRNIMQYVVEDEENQTAYLRFPGNHYWWYWYGSEYEAHAYTLKLLARTDPKGRLASRLVKYILNNRKNGTYWNSTRDTAICIEAMAEYLVNSGESKPDMTVEIWLNGSKRKEVAIKPSDLFTFDNKFVLVSDAVEPGEQVLELRRRGTGPVYWNAYLTNFTLEDPITAAGLEIKVDRKVYKLVPEDKKISAAGSSGQAVKQRVEKYRREPLESGSILKSGDLVEVELEIESKNDYEYLVFEDMKAAGFEPVEVRSGYGGNEMGAYMELRDERVAFFVRWLARGRHSVSYRMRAEIPGRFSALPTRASAMYAPELRANSDEWKASIID